MAVTCLMPDHVAQQMEAFIADGLFRSPDEVLEAAMGLLMRQMADEKLRADIAAGAADIAAGRARPYTADIISEIKAKGRAALAAQQRL